MPAPGLAETAAQRPEQPQLLPGEQLGQAVGARSHVLEQEVGLAVFDPGDRERPRQEGPPVRSAPPTLGGRQHRELTSGGQRAVGVAHAHDAVGAEPIDARDRQAASPEGSQGTLGRTRPAHATSLGASAARPAP